MALIVGKITVDEAPASQVSRVDDLEGVRPLLFLQIRADLVRVVQLDSELCGCRECVFSCKKGTATTKSHQEREGEGRDSIMRERGRKRWNLAPRT